MSEVGDEEAVSQPGQPSVVPILASALGNAGAAEEGSAGAGVTMRKQVSAPKTRGSKQKSATRSQKSVTVDQFELLESSVTDLRQSMKDFMEKFSHQALGVSSAYDPPRPSGGHFTDGAFGMPAMAVASSMPQDSRAFSMPNNVVASSMPQEYGALSMPDDVGDSDRVLDPDMP